MSELSVADQLQFDALEPDVRALVERVVAAELEPALDAAYYRGAAAERDAPGELMLPADCRPLSSPEDK